jgi:hypothetical protein
MRQDYDDGKYTVIFDEKTGNMEALRHGEPWQDLCGNNLVYFMLAEHKSALDRIAELEKFARWIKENPGCHKANIQYEAERLIKD